MQREGSALHGLGVVILKELSDHLTSVRMRVLEWLVVLFALAALYGAIQQIRETTAEDPFLFLKLFTTAREPLPFTFVSFLSILVPLIAITLFSFGARFKPGRLEVLHALHEQGHEIDGTEQAHAENAGDAGRPGELRVGPGGLWLTPGAGLARRRGRRPGRRWPGTRRGCLSRSRRRDGAAVAGAWRATCGAIVSRRLQAREDARISDHPARR